MLRAFSKPVIEKPRQAISFGRQQGICGCKAYGYGRKINARLPGEFDIPDNKGKARRDSVLPTYKLAYLAGLSAKATETL